MDSDNIIQNRIKASIKVSVGGCWEWQLYIRRNGYGQMKFEGKTVDAHRVSYRCFHGEIPEGIYVCHRCDNKRCCNPEHLFLGTQADNMRDHLAKGGKLGKRRFRHHHLVEAMRLRQEGKHYWQIGNALGFSTMAVWQNLNAPLANDNAPLNVVVGLSEQKRASYHPKLLIKLRGTSVER